MWRVFPTTGSLNGRVRPPGAYGAAMVLHGPSGQPAREQLLTTDSREVGDAVVVTVRGEVDVMTAPRLRDAVARAFDAPEAGAVVLDLTGVTFLGSNGLAALVDAVTEARQRREPLRVVVDDTRPVLRPLQLTGLDSLLALYHSVEEALAR